jgi:archaellum component FlaC
MTDKNFRQLVRAARLKSEGIDIRSQLAAAKAEIERLKQQVADIEKGFAEYRHDKSIVNVIRADERKRVAEEIAEWIDGLSEFELIDNCSGDYIRRKYSVS